MESSISSIHCLTPLAVMGEAHVRCYLQQGYQGPKTDSQFGEVTLGQAKQPVTCFCEPPWRCCDQTGINSTKAVDKTMLVQAGRPAIKPGARAIWSARDMQHITNRDTARTHGYVSREETPYLQQRKAIVTLDWQGCINCGEMGKLIVETDKRLG